MWPLSATLPAWQRVLPLLIKLYRWRAIQMSIYFNFCCVSVFLCMRHWLRIAVVVVLKIIIPPTWKNSNHKQQWPLQEIPENGADVAHLSQVHGPIMTAGIDLRYTYSKWWSFARHDWAGQWNQDPDPDRKHIGVLDLMHRIHMFGFRFPILDLKVTARQVRSI